MVTKRDRTSRSRRAFGLHGNDLEYAVGLITAVCALAGSPTYLSELQASARRDGLVKAVREHDNPTLFDWFVSASSFQGMSDAVAQGYMERNGRARWKDLDAELSKLPKCPKLGGYWKFERCGYLKSHGECGEPCYFAKCPLPLLPLRNGNLNQLSYSLFFFMRDVALNDFVSWVDHRLSSVRDATRSSLDELSQVLIGPMRNIHGISDKVINLVLSTLLLGAGRNKTLWVEVGGTMIAIDSLVHNFLRRTGILRRADAEHPYGPACYQNGGCAEALQFLSAHIDCRQFNQRYPRRFPRFVQKAIWRYCAMEGLNICNGNKIDDSARCLNSRCRLYGACDRVALNLSGIT